MVARGDERRQMIARHAIAVVARGGARALTHQAVDRSAGLSTGSTSYYYRTRSALIEAAVEHILSDSRAAFAAAEMPEVMTVSAAANIIAGQVQILTGDRRDQAIAVFALLPEVVESAGGGRALSRCLFSAPRAEDLMRALRSDDPPADALDLIAFLTGLLYQLLFGDVRRNARDPRAAITHYVATLVG